jgi:hypothetical protein
MNTVIMYVNGREICAAKVGTGTAVSWHCKRNKTAAHLDIFVQKEGTAMKVIFKTVMIPIIILNQVLRINPFGLSLSLSQRKNNGSTMDLYLGLAIITGFPRFSSVSLPNYLREAHFCFNPNAPQININPSLYQTLLYASCWFIFRLTVLS